MRGRAMVSIGAAALVLLAGCGDDDDDAVTDDAPATTTAGSSPASTSATTAGSTDGTAAAGSAVPADDLCALAQQLYDQEDFPSAEQLEQYQALAPDEIAGAVDTASAAILDAGDDLVAQLNAIGDDDTEAAIAEINVWEEENCGIPHSEDSALAAGATREIEDDAARVDVIGTDFAFDIGTVAPGRTSFVLVNEGAEAHFMAIVKLAEGVTLEQAMASEDGEGMTEGEWDTDIASAGEEEAVTFDVEPGNYAMVCFLPTTDGTPHAMLGMQLEFTVA